MSENLVTLLLKLPRNTDVTPEAAQTFLSALTQINPNTSTSILDIFKGSNAKPIALEIVLFEGRIQFQLTCDVDLMPFIETQIHSNYPLTVIEKIKDPLVDLDTSALQAAYLKLNAGDYYPLSTFTAFKDVDPLSSLLSVLSKAPANEVAIIQIALESANPKWQSNGMQFAEFGEKKEDGGYKPRPDANIIKEKISLPGFMTSIRIASTDPSIMQATISAFEVFKRSDGNSLTPTYPTKKKLEKEIEHLKTRKTADKQILNIAELATLWHLPSDKIKTPSLVWGSSVLSEPPANLPIATDLSDEEKGNVNFFAKTIYKNEETVFGIKNKDRLRHIWVVGKTGTGKSTMIANMAIDDVKKGRGIAIIDPHGDLCEDILNYVPSNRINDTIYFNPADRDYPIAINPLEVTNREEAELVVAGLMSIFTKVWANVWSARMEYILRNTFMTLTEIPDSTLADVLKLLSNQSYRNKVVAKLEDQALIHFWKDEFDAMPEKLQKEAISPIQNKVGQFITSPMIRRIIGTPKSSISIDEIMNEKKILLINLSQGRLGEDNAALLGAMMITKFQLAAMHRVDTPKEERVPFHLYVDEFQNFATESFIKILSEARKYGLALLLANQYMAQIPEQITKAILGNAGSMVSFSVGADDARVFHKEFAEVFTENDLVNLENYQIAIKLMIDSHSTRPFVANTLPLPSNVNKNREKVIRVSRERWAKAATDDQDPEKSNNQTTQKPQTNPNTNSEKKSEISNVANSPTSQNVDLSNDSPPPSKQPQQPKHHEKKKHSNNNSQSNNKPISKNNNSSGQGQKKKKKKDNKSRHPGNKPKKKQHKDNNEKKNDNRNRKDTKQHERKNNSDKNSKQATHSREVTQPSRNQQVYQSSPPVQSPPTPVKTIQGEKEMMGENGFENKESSPQKVRDNTQDNSADDPPDNYPNAPRIPTNQRQAQSDKTQPRHLPADHPLMQQPQAQMRTSQSPIQAKRKPQTRVPQQPIRQQSQSQPKRTSQQNKQPRPTYPPRTTQTQRPQTMPAGFPTPNFPQQPQPGMPPFPGQPQQYPPPRPAFDAEKDRREREAKQAEDKAKLADLMDQLQTMKNNNG